MCRINQKSGLSIILREEEIVNTSIIIINIQRQIISTQILKVTKDLNLLILKPTVKIITMSTIY